MKSPKKFKIGWRNNYRASMPWSEVIAKDIACVAGDFFRWISNGFRLPTVVAWPDYPSKKTTLFKIAGKLRWRLTNKAVSKPQLVVSFDDSTLSAATDVADIFPGCRILNIGCTDISKTKVDAVHLHVFGYNTMIDPKSFEGIAVRKSNDNALHDGQIVLCPIQQPECNSVYQLLLDNTVDDEYVMDYRVPVVGRSIPLVYCKYKKNAVRFTNEVTRSEMKNTAEIFSEIEQNNILDFCSAMGAQFCELDIIRHKVDGRIYIIDLNKTPYGPPKGLTQSDSAVEILASSFSRAFLQHH